MTRKKTGWFGKLRNKIWAAIASIITAVGGFTAAYYWTDITGKPAPAALTGEGRKAPVVIGSLTSLQQGAVSTCDLLGSDVREQHDRVTIVTVKPGSIGAQLGLVPGDVIESVDNHPITSPELLEGSLARSHRLLSTTVKVRRGEATLRGEVHLGNDSHLVVRRPVAQ